MRLAGLLLFALPLVAQQNATIRGVVTDGVTHQPIAAAHIFAVDMHDDSVDTTTAADGSYSVIGPAGRWFVQASDGTRASLWKQLDCLGPNNVICGGLGDPIDVVPGEVRDGIDFALKSDVPFGTLKGTLRDLAGNGYNGGGLLFYDAKSGTKYRGKPVPFGGAFSFNLPPRDYIVMSNDGTPLHAAADGTLCNEPCPWVRSTISIAAGATITKDFVVPGFGVTDVVPDNGPESGGTAGVMRGSWYYVPTGVTIGTLPAQAVPRSFSSIDVTTPPGSGAADVKLTLPFNRSNTLHGGFHYVPNGQSYLAMTSLVSPIRLGNDAVVTVTLSPPRPTATTITLANSDPDRLAVPATVTIPAGAATTTFTAHPLQYGGGKLTASAPDAVASSLIVQVLAPRVTVALPEHVDTSKDAFGTLTIDPVQTADTYLSLWGLDDYVNERLVVPAGQSSIQIALRDVYTSPHFEIDYPLYLGGNVAADLTLNDRPVPHISTDLPRYRITVGTPAKGRLLLSDWASFNALITFFPSANNVTIKQATINSGAVVSEFIIEASAPGIVTVTADSRFGPLSFDVEAVAPVSRRRAAGR